MLSIKWATAQIALNKALDSAIGSQFRLHLVREARPCAAARPKWPGLRLVRQILDTKLRGRGTLTDRLALETALRFGFSPAPGMTANLTKVNPMSRVSTVSDVYFVVGNWVAWWRSTARPILLYLSPILPLGSALWLVLAAGSANRTFRQHLEGNPGVA